MLCFVPLPRGRLRWAGFAGVGVASIRRTLRSCGLGAPSVSTVVMGMNSRYYFLIFSWLWSDRAPCPLPQGNHFCFPRGALTARVYLGLFPQGNFFRTVRLACSPRGMYPARAHPPAPLGGAFPHGAPCLFPQGNTSRTGTPPRSPRGSLPARYALLVSPGERFPHGHAFC